MPHAGRRDLDCGSPRPVCTTSRTRSRRRRARWPPAARCEAIARRPRGVRAGQRALADEARSSAAGQPSRWSTTPTTPTPIRCAPRSTCSPALPGPRWLVLGDMGEVGDQGPAFHAEVGAYAKERGIERFWTVGAALHAMRPTPSRGARHFDDVASLIAALAQAPGLQRGARQGLALHEDGAGRRGAAARSRGAVACCLAWPSGCRRSRRRVRLLARVPVPHLPRGDGGDDRAADRPRVRPVGHPPADRAEDRPADPRVRRADAPGQERHADDGRRADPDRHRRLDAAVVRLEQPLRLDRDGGDDRLRRDRLGRRLAQGRAQEPGRHALAREVLLAVADRPGRRAVPRVQRVRDLEPARAASSSCAGCRAASRTTCRRRPT